MVFQDWLFKLLYEPPLNGSPFLNSVAALPDRNRWAAMERINTSNACHYFTACRVDRPVETYRVETATESVFEAIPIFRYRCGFAVDKVFRYDWQIRLSPAHVALVRLIDGHRSIREIIARVQHDPDLKDQNPELFSQLAWPIFRDLVDLDFIVLGI